MLLNEGRAVGKKKFREYLRALRSADRGSFGPLAELFARAVLDSIYRFTVPSTQGEDALVPLMALATAELNVNSMKAAIARSRVRAQKGSDWKWRSTKAWVDAYLKSRQQGGADTQGSLGHQ